MSTYQDLIDRARDENAGRVGATTKNLAAIKASWLQLLADETMWQNVHGPKMNYSLDGVSYTWTEWQSAILDKIKQINEMIQIEDLVTNGPWEVQSFGR